MTGDYCDSTQSCCGGSPDAINPTDDPYGIFCDTTGKLDVPPRNDPSSKDDFRCTGGTSCNPPGNICGGSGAVNASQNCCDGKKAVCKPDSNGIHRCFGGCPDDDCSACPSGYDANDPDCCIPAAPDQASATTANVCQFRDQCCGGAPCVPDASGVLHCVAAPAACKPAGTSCDGEGDATCCAPNSCLFDATAGGDICKVDSTACTATGDGCADDSECCSRVCLVDACVDCVPNGSTCATGAECCSGSCDAETSECVPACQAELGQCTGDADCCSGLVCTIAPGATSGTCGSQQMCADMGETCYHGLPCCAGSCFNASDGGIPCFGPSSGCTCDE
jgi:hypothetical protein